MSKDHWANQSEKTNHWGIVFLLTIHRYFGRLPFRILLGPVVLFYWLCDQSIRANSLKYLQNAYQFGLFKKKPTLWLSLHHIAFFGETILDKFLAMTSQDDQSTLHIENDDLIMQCIAQGQGAIVLTSHMGCVEKLMHHGMQLQDVEIIVLLHSLHAKELNAMLHSSGRHLGKIKFIEVTDLTPASACEIESYVQRGALVFIAGDRVPIASEATCQIPFLNKMAHFPIGGVILANLFHCPLFSITCWRTPKIKKTLRGQTNHYTVRFGNLSCGNAVRLTRRSRANEIAVLMQQFAKELEATLRQSPLDWFNFYDFWLAKGKINSEK